MSILYLNDSFLSLSLALANLQKMCKYEMPPLSQELLCNIIYNDSFQTSLT